MTQVDDAFSPLNTTPLTQNDLVGNVFKEVNTINQVLKNVKSLEESNSAAVVTTSSATSTAIASAASAAVVSANSYTDKTVTVATSNTLSNANSYTDNSINDLKTWTTGYVADNQYVSIDNNGNAKVNGNYVVTANLPTAPSITVLDDGSFTITPNATTQNEVVAPITKYKIYYNINNTDYVQEVPLNTLSGTLANLPTDTLIYNLTYSVSSVNTFGEGAKSSSKNVAFQAHDYNIYGVSWNLGSDPTLTRTDASVGLVAGINGAQNDFDSKSVWKKITQVTDSLGNIFIRVPKVYIRKTQTSSLATWQVSLKNQGSDWYLPACFYDFANSKELDYVDISAYEGSVANGKLKSVSGVAPTTSLSIVDFRKNAVANGNGYQLWDIHVNDLLQVLFIVEFATLNSQSIMAGATSNSAAINTGSANGHKGSSGTGTSGAMSYRGIENVYGNANKWCDGINFNVNTPYVCTDSSKYQSDLFASPYIQLNYTGVSSSSSGGITRMGFDSTKPFAQIPVTNGGMYTTYYSDYDYGNSSGNTVLYTGGRWNDTSDAGLFYSNWNGSSTNASSNIGSRLIKKAL